MKKNHSTPRTRRAHEARLRKARKARRRTDRCIRLEREATTTTPSEVTPAPIPERTSRGGFIPTIREFTRAVTRMFTRRTSR